MGSSFNQTELISYKSVNIGTAAVVGVPATTEAKGSSTSQTKPQRASYKQLALQGGVEIHPNLSEKNELIHAKEESLQELWPHPHPGHNEIEILNDVGDKSFLPSNQQTLGQAELNLLLDDYIEQPEFTQVKAVNTSSLTSKNKVSINVSKNHLESRQQVPLFLESPTLGKTVCYSQNKQTSPMQNNSSNENLLSQASSQQEQKPEGHEPSPNLDSKEEGNSSTSKVVEEHAPINEFAYHANELLLTTNSDSRLQGQVQGPLEQLHPSSTGPENKQQIISELYRMFKTDTQDVRTQLQTRSHENSWNQKTKNKNSIVIRHLNDWSVSESCSCLSKMELCPKGQQLKATLGKNGVVPLSKHS